MSADFGSQIFIRGISQLDRSKWFNIHGAPGSGSVWTESEIEDIVQTKRAHLGRAFAFSSRMQTQLLKTQLVLGTFFQTR